LRGRVAVNSPDSFLVQSTLAPVADGRTAYAAAYFRVVARFMICRLPPAPRATAPRSRRTGSRLLMQAEHRAHRCHRPVQV